MSLNKASECFENLSMNGKSSMMSRPPPFVLRDVEGTIDGFSEVSIDRLLLALIDTAESPTILADRWR